MPPDTARFPWRAAAALAVALAFVAVVAVPRSGPDPPPPERAPAPPLEYRDLYAALEGRLAAFEATVSARWNGSRSNVAFSAELLTANANRGSALLNASVVAAVRLELGRLAALGAKAVTVSLGYPILDPWFFGNSSAYDAYLAFYRRVAADVRGAGLKLVIDASVLFPTYVDLPVSAYYRNLTYAGFLAGRVRNAVVSARELSPDFLAFSEEPDTEQALTGFPIGNPANFTTFVNGVVAGVRAAGITGVPLGAGVGSWDPRWREYATTLAENTSLDFLDYHVYPVNFDLMTRLWAMADIAKAHGKRVGIGEAWMYKARDSELSQGVYFDEIFRRDAFSFWAPLDSRFLWDLVNYSHAEGLAFLSPYWSKFLHAYLSYLQYSGASYAEVTVQSNIAAATAMTRGEFSETGTAYGVAIGGIAPPEPARLGGLLVLLLAGLVVMAVIILLVVFTRRRRQTFIRPPPVPPPRGP